MSDGMSTLLGILVFAFAILGWLQLTGLLPIDVPLGVNLMAIVGAAILGIIAYAWISQGSGMGYR